MYLVYGISLMLYYRIWYMLMLKYGCWYHNLWLMCMFMLFYEFHNNWWLLRIGVDDGITGWWVIACMFMLLVIFMVVVECCMLLMCMHIHLVVVNSHCVELVSWPISVAELEWAVRFYLCPSWNGTVCEFSSLSVPHA